MKPTNSIIERIAGIVKYFSRLKIGIHAAGTGYFIVLSVFPLLALLLGLLRYSGLQTDTLVRLVGSFLPDALLPAARDLIENTYRNSSGAVISLSAFTGLWSASRGIYGLLTGLNSIYQVTENRGYFYTRAISMVYTVLFLLLLLATIVPNIFGITLLELLPTGDTPFLQFLWGIVDLRFFVLLLLQTALFTAMFVVLPNRRNRVAESLPGAMLASAGWLIFSDLYSVYVKNVSDYSSIFGPVYAVALTMLWLYFCISILFYGGALNVYLAEKQ